MTTNNRVSVPSRIATAFVGALVLFAFGTPSFAAPKKESSVQVVAAAREKPTVVAEAPSPSIPNAAQGGLDAIPVARPLENGSGFEPQFGIGITAIPAQQFWFLDYRATYYQYGGQIDLLFRVHDLVTIEISPSLTGLGIDSTRTQKYLELSSFFGVRVFFLRPPKGVYRMHVAPYAAVGTYLSGIFQTYQSSWSGYAGPFLGVGLEWRMTPHIALHADVRSTIQGELLSFLGTRVGLRGHLGVGFYF